jgi:hypothetical protein
MPLYASVQEKICCSIHSHRAKGHDDYFFISRLAFFVTIITLSVKSYSNCSYDKINGLGKIYKYLFYVESFNIHNCSLMLIFISLTAVTPGIYIT